MGDDRELQQTSIPMPVNETSHPPRPTAADLASENVPKASLLGHPGGDTPPPEAHRKMNAGESILFVLALVIFIPLYLIYALVVYLVCSKDVSDKSTSGGVPDGEKPSFQHRVREFEGTAVQAAKLAAVVHSRFVILLMIWLLINLGVRSLRKKIILGSELWKWTLLIVIIFCGYSVISMVTSLVLHYFTKAYEKRKSAVYYAEGLRRSVNFLLLWISVILTWHFYFRSRKGLRETGHIDILFHIIRWSLVSFLIFRICWLLKNILLLKWKAQAVYDRFSDRILRAGFQWYFLGLLSGTNWDIFKPKAEKNGPSKDTLQDEETAFSQERRANVDSKEKKKATKEKKIIKDIKAGKLSKDSTLYTLKTMAKVFVNIAKLLSRDEEDNISETLSEWSKKIKDHTKEMKEEDLEIFGVKENDRKLLYDELKGKDPHIPVSFNTIKKWMVRANRNCLAMGYTLIDAKEVVHCLDVIMSAAIIVVIFIAWLLLTGLATTKLLVLIVSPFLAGTFIFGDTCKTLFEGIMFAFVKHPFDVGDLCIIDGCQLEVKQIGVLTTIFLAIDGKQEMWFPNSVLITKAIVNLKRDPDLSDCIELNLDKATEDSQIKDLEEEINKILKDDKGFEDHCHIIYKEVGSCIKIVINFNHLMDILEVSHSQCFEKKSNQRSKLGHNILLLLTKLNIKTV
ncbi:hypothetical protein Nepgr_017843 [Nepenthes gracilis]|uniref:Mechanosensitive ion channel MscS domain-containing protein n=1 Tax=Nepenthes gracilis TaxID=150966 RepID=A0AAD3XSI7_NEPGR|nr:hypothetical protein Nepgr_017843 [Nepenthes gracilis]